MSFQAMAWAVDQMLPTREKFVLMILANYASNDTWDCYPSLTTIAANTGMSRDTVMRAIKQLESIGAVSTIRRMSDGVNLPNIYRINKSADLRGVVAVCDQGSSSVRLGVVAESDSNLSLEPINEPKASPSASATPDSAEAVPHEKIRELYNSILGGKLPRCMGLTDTHRKHIRACNNLKLDGGFPVREKGLEFWEGLFNDVLDCPFLMGSNNRAWAADFEFLTTATKIQRFMEGKYDAR